MILIPTFRILENKDRIVMVMKEGKLYTNTMESEGSCEFTMGFTSRADQGLR
ncbi:hypothetical protein SAMN05216353_10953 [Halobacillus alkaliphilus]|uniref:Uncharacterized protein n=1 Tax=Halobacillus alkaliphilus TaxID=396056 RepID=A0A1I2LJ26_9BACI|nr:hypothetical protein SAMN05216353_10953 [Halobacillus alkaliphilus]